jgi:predicted nucleic acid-binding protein
MGLNKRGFEKRIPAGDRVLIDTSVLIAYFEPNDATHALATLLVDDFVRNGRNVAVISPISAMEVLVRPLRVAPRGAVHVHDFLIHTPNLKLLPIDLHVAQEAASLRATHNFKSPDALVIATGFVGQVGHLVTNDADWQRKLAPMTSRIRVAELQDYLRAS